MNDINLQGITMHPIMKTVDLGSLYQRTKSNPQLMMEMISLYLEQTPPLIVAMKKSYNDKDWDTLYATVHKMIPSFSIIGISPEIEDMAKKVQEFAGSPNEEAGINELVQQIESTCNEACKELEIELNILKNNKA